MKKRKKKKEKKAVLAMLFATTRPVSEEEVLEYRCGWVAMYVCK